MTQRPLGRHGRAPTPTQRTQIESGPIDGNNQDVTAADNGKLHVVPVGLGANAVIVNLPTACRASAAPSSSASARKTTLENLEKAWNAATVVTWGELMPGLQPAAGCADEKIQRVVRFDSSGTTFSFKQLLHQIDPTHLWAQRANQEWPNNTGATAVLRGESNGNGPLVAKVVATAGSLGYSDLATARGVGVFTYEDRDLRQDLLASAATGEGLGHL